MGSYTERKQQREEKAKKKSDSTQPTRSQGKSNEPKDFDRLSTLGSIRSDMSTSALEKRLADAQARISQLETCTLQQQKTIERLMELVTKRK